MKGTIIDFCEEENSGLILGEDGNRYSFDSVDYKSKNSIVSIDSEVDFVVDENRAKDIYSIKTKTNDGKVEEEKTVLLNSQNSNFKKIDFEKIKEQFKNKNLLNSVRSKFRVKLIISIIPLIVFIIFLNSLPPKSDFLTFVSWVLIVINSLFTISFLATMLLPSKEVKRIVLRDIYNNQLKRVEYTPQDLIYNELKRIHVKEDTFKDAEDKLLEQAFDLRADTIINYKYQFATSSKVSGRTKIDTEIEEYHIIDGTAIKLI